MRRYIDEFMDSNSNLIYSYYDIKDKVLQLNSKGKSVDEIIKFLQNWLYIFDDEEEIAWEKEVVINIINGKESKNRFTSEKFC